MLEYHVYTYTPQPVRLCRRRPTYRQRLAAWFVRHEEALWTLFGYAILLTMLWAATPCGGR
jgi:hypothetical protein